MISLPDAITAVINTADAAVRLRRRSRHQRANLAHSIVTTDELIPQLSA